MLMVSTYLAPSAIEGLGVFAGESIKREHLLWSLNSQFDVFVKQSEIEELPPHMQDYLARYCYPHLEMPGLIVLDGDNGRYMNHSLAPNTDFRIFDKGYALVDIGQGDELTCNYHEFDPTFTGFFDNPRAEVANRWPRANGRSQRR
jgi:SET domain-containing protein